jgi:hypothetical protein
LDTGPETRSKIALVVVDTEMEEWITKEWCFYGLMRYKEEIAMD